MKQTQPEHHSTNLENLISSECKENKKQHAASQLPLMLDRELQSQTKLHASIQERHKDLPVLI